MNIYLKQNNMKLQELAYELAADHGYKYTADPRFIDLDRSNKIKIGGIIMFILEQEQ